jgi:hypothetical protein
MDKCGPQTIRVEPDEMAAAQRLQSSEHFTGVRFDQAGGEIEVELLSEHSTGCQQAEKLRIEEVQPAREERCGLA